MAVHFFRRDCGSLKPTLLMSRLLTFKFEFKPRGIQQKSFKIFCQNVHFLNISGIQE